MNLRRVYAGPFSRRYIDAGLRAIMNSPSNPATNGSLIIPPPWLLRERRGEIKVKRRLACEQKHSCAPFVCFPLWRTDGVGTSKRNPNSSGLPWQVSLLSFCSAPSRFKAQATCLVVEVGPSDSSHAGNRVLDIEYSSGTTFTAKVLTDDGVDLYQQNGPMTVTKIMSAKDGLPADNINFITPLENGNTAISPSKNTVQVIHSPDNEANGETTITTLDLDSSNGNFTIMDLAESVSGTQASWMMVNNARHIDKPQRTRKHI